jgi:hypothetical protein
MSEPERHSTGTAKVSKCVEGVRTNRAACPNAAADLIARRHQRQVEQRIGSSCVRLKQIHNGLYTLREAAFVDLDGAHELERLQGNARRKVGGEFGQLRWI